MLTGRSVLTAFLFIVITAGESQSVTAQIPSNDSIRTPIGPPSLVFKGTTWVAANPGYAAGTFRRFFLGERYRDAWTELVEAPNLDLDETSGGLRVTGSAGDKRSAVLYLAAENGRHYVLRTLDKEAGQALPAATRRTIVEDIAQDQISSLHPYGAFIVSELARAAGLYHLPPMLVFVVDNPRLGEYRDVFAGKLALLERNIVKDFSAAAQLGFTEEVVGTKTLIHRLESGPDYFLDEHAYLKTRLFDMLVGDRDRHEEQYLWSAFANAGRTRFVPIPVDRDFAFSRFDGLLPRVGRATTSTLLRNLTNFGEDVDNLVGLNYQGAMLDYRFTSSLDRDDWIEAARELQREITDEVIERAVGAWPDVLQDGSGSITIADLKSRRDKLDEAADEYYKILARRVDVIGSAASEQFTIYSTGPETVAVEVHVFERSLWDSPSATHDAPSYQAALNGVAAPVRSQVTYRRTFDEGATEEIRLFGQGGEDRFIVRGEGAGGIVVRAIGGDGGDTFLDESTVGNDRIYFYDEWLDGDEVEGDAHVESLPDTLANSYVMHRYELNATAPLFTFHYDSDQGLFVGGGVRMVRFGFRKEPYAARHVITAEYAPKSEGFNVQYEGHLVDLWKTWDAVLEADLLAEDVFRGFYGMGNETPKSNRELFDARFRWITASPGLERTFGPLVSLRLGPRFEAAQIKPPRGFTVDDAEVGYSNYEMTDRYVGGFGATVLVDSRDSTMIPRTGIRWISHASVHLGLQSRGVRFARLASELSGYGSVGPFTLALRAGGARNVGDFAFYQANFLSGDKNVRGFNKRRFAGRSSAYGNAELRLDLSEFNVYLVRGRIGVLGFADVGRVWADGEISNAWHQGYGGGMWITPFNRFIMTGTLAFSEDGSIFDLSLGLFF